MACNRLILLSSSLVGVESRDVGGDFLVLLVVGESRTDAAGWWVVWLPPGKVPKHGGAGTQQASSFPLCARPLVGVVGSGLLLVKSSVVLSLSTDDDASPPALLLLGWSGLGFDEREGIIIEGSSIEGSNELNEGNKLLESLLSAGTEGGPVFVSACALAVAVVFVGCAGRSVLWYRGKGRL